MQKKTPEMVAAVDLGSNSFHMVVCELKNGKPQTVDRLREMVRLAAGLDHKNFLDEAVQRRALACLERFGQRLRALAPGSVRCVGTNTLRIAKNADEFLERAEIALGHPIEIISGIEEARLIYEGVAHSLESDAQRRLVIDIGGGSTEYIIGTGDTPLHMESLRMGCVSLSQAFFDDGHLSKKRFQRALLHATQCLEPIELMFRRGQWGQAIGASGTFRAVQKTLAATGWSQHGISWEGLERLVQHLNSVRHVNELALPEIDSERAPVFPGGVAIIYASFKLLGITQMTISDGALREGLIYDLLGRLFDHDIRTQTVAALAERYHVDQVHARRVAQTARGFLAQLAQHPPFDHEAAAQWLEWAAQLHEIGLDIAHSSYQKHSAYIIEHADLAGFSRQDQQVLATIVRHHRRKLAIKKFKKLPPPWQDDALWLTLLLRLAVVLHRNRHDTELPPCTVSLRHRRLFLEFADGWLDQSPLTRADLESEAEYLRAAGFDLVYC